MELALRYLIDHLPEVEDLYDSSDLPRWEGFFSEQTAEWGTQ